MTVHYVQSQNKVEQILAAIRETVSSGVGFAEDKLSHILEVCTFSKHLGISAHSQLLTSSKLTAEEKYEKAKASVASALTAAVSSASSYASVAGASATSAASVASASLSYVA